MSQEIMTFGKYKGESVEVLATDKKYAEWLLAQPWFKQEHLNIYTIVVNNFRHPVDTPEHNALQVKFLDPKYALKLAYLLKPDIFYWTPEKITEVLKSRLGDIKDIKHLEAIKNKINNLPDQQLLHISEPNLENKYDVSYSARYGIYLNFDYFMQNQEDIYSFSFNNNQFMNIALEIKPTIGDDFPSVLRQIKASMPITMEVYDNIVLKKTFYCLLVGEYTGVGASKEQFIQYFQSQKYNVIFVKDLESVLLPDYEEYFNCKEQV
ncbi:MAG: hypothetical protein CXR30_19395 [Geobacter sp.]|nr:MAG: hypothetical protein CXR30_19395 [Geobacter sp.]